MRISKTENYKSLERLYFFSRLNALSLIVCGEPGIGKSFNSQYLSKNNDNYYYLQVQESWTKKKFLMSLAKCLSAEYLGMSSSRLIEVIVEQIRTLSAKENILLIIDEADKLKRKINLFIELYNLTKGSCSIVLLGTPFLHLNLIGLAKKDRIGGKELLSRFGTEKGVVFLNQPSVKDLDIICKDNGLDKDETKDIKNFFSGDLRYIERQMTKLKILKNKK